MRVSRDSNGNELPDSERLTPIGRFFRRFSLDELPTLLNVIKGDMSLVGPRPLLMRYLPFFSEQEMVRFSVRPGITGLAQISGRNMLEWGKRFALDVQYVEQLSWRKDLSIIVRTIWRVLASKGVHPDPGSVMQDLDVERSSPTWPIDR